MSEPVVFTFHKIREQGEQGKAGAWRAFLDFYTPVLFRLLEIHAGMQPAQASATLKRMLAELAANGFGRFRATSRQSEREFLTDLRALLLDIALEATTPLDSSNSRFQSEKITRILSDLPLLHKEMVFFKLAGYTDETIERLMRLSPRVATKAFERLKGEFEPALQLQRDACPWPAEWLRFLNQTRSAKTDSCIPAHQCLRIHDGQVSWYDKEPVEKHVSACLHCLEMWTALRELGYWRQAASELSGSAIERFLEVIPVEQSAPQKKSFFRRLGF